FRNGPTNPVAPIGAGTRLQETLCGSSLLEEGCQMVKKCTGLSWHVTTGQKGGRGKQRRAGPIQIDAHQRPTCQIIPTHDIRHQANSQTPQNELVYEDSVVDDHAWLDSSVARAPWASAKYPVPHLILMHDHVVVLEIRIFAWASRFFQIRGRGVK